MTGPVESASARVLDWLSYLLILLVVIAATLLSFAFLPWRVNGAPVPVAVLISAVMLWWAIRAGYAFRPRMWAASAPLLLWLVFTLVLAFVPNLGYFLVPQDWRSPLLLGVGVLTGAVALGGVWGDHLSARIKAERAAAGSR